MTHLKLLLTLILFAAAFWPVNDAFAEETEIAESPLPAAQAPVVVELFSSQACAFCPAADRLLGELSKQENIIALACHVDYFDVKEGSLSQPFCDQRQGEYVEILSNGPQYTPQMIVNGHTDVIGYETGQVTDAIMIAREEGVTPVKVERKPEGGYGFKLAPHELAEGQEIKLWMALFDKPHILTVSDGINRGKKMTYYNIVSELVELGPWSGEQLEQSLKPELKESHAGFVVAAQDTKTGRIIAAGAIYTQ